MCNCKGWDIAFYPEDEITVEQHFCRVYGDCGHVDNTLEEAADQLSSMIKFIIGIATCEIVICQKLLMKNLTGYLNNHELGKTELTQVIFTIQKMVVDISFSIDYINSIIEVPQR